MGNANGRDSLIEQNEVSALPVSSSLDRMSAGTSTSRPILTFHGVHGEHVRIMKNGIMAKRVESFCKGLAFSARPIAIDEIVCLKFTEMATNWSGVLRFGVTNTDPASLYDSLPKFACPDLTTKEGNWAKALAERYCQQGSILHFYVRENGELYYGINGVLKGLFLSGINAQSPLYVLVDIYGNSNCLEFLDPAEVRFRPSRHKNSEKKSTSPTSGGSIVRQNTAPTSEMGTLTVPLRVNMDNEINSRPRSLSTEIPPTRFHSGVNFQNVPFHVVHGQNVSLSSDKSIAFRTETEYTSGYVFTSRPVQLNEKIVVQVLNTLTAYSGGLAFGLTSCDPLNLNPETLPDDSDDLLERLEYWVGIKDIAASPKPTDELAFYIDSEGRVYFYRNNGTARVVMHVDHSQRLWMYFDVYGSTQKVRILGSTNVSSRSGPIRRQNTLPAGASTSQSPSNVALPQPLQPLRVNLPPASSSRTSPEPPPSRGISLVSTPSTSTRPPVPPPRPATLPKPQPKTAPHKPPVPPRAESVELDECAVCMSEQIDCVLYTCGHMCMCYDCAYEQWGRKGECPICREQIKDVIRTYKS